MGSTALDQQATDPLVSSPQRCSFPTATSENVPFKGVGSSSKDVPPQHLISPDSVRPQLKDDPTSTCLYRPGNGLSSSRPSALATPPQQTADPSALMPHEWKIPTSKSEYSPAGGLACPAPLNPQHSTDPASVMPQVVLVPAATTLKLPWGGEMQPESSFPQHATEPSLLIAQLCPPPAFSFLNLPTGGTVMLWLLEPQHLMVPSPRRPQVCPEPAPISIHVSLLPDPQPPTTRDRQDTLKRQKNLMAPPFFAPSSFWPVGILHVSCPAAGLLGASAPDGSARSVYVPSIDARTGMDWPRPIAESCAGRVTSNAVAAASVPARPYA